jgi:hypothetical protein
MDKYIVKKELPWLRVGAVVWVENGYLYKEIDKFDGLEYIGEPICLGAECYRATLNYFEDGLDNTEWFEKVNPYKSLIDDIYMKLKGLPELIDMEDIDWNADSDYLITTIKHLLADANIYSQIADDIIKQIENLYQKEE